MADRRVERREIMTGTGMMNDPERLAEIEERRHKSELNARLPPKVKFGAVLNAPAKVERGPKRKRPLSKEKLTPSAAHPAQHAAAFFRTEEDDLAEILGEEKTRFVLKV